jgi:hypothetical protein
MCGRASATASPVSQEQLKKEPGWCGAWARRSAMMSGHSCGRPGGKWDDYDDRDDDGKDVDHDKRNHNHDGIDMTPTAK